MTREHSRFLEPDPNQPFQVHLLLCTPSSPFKLHMSFYKHHVLLCSCLRNLYSSAEIPSNPQTPAPALRLPRDLPEPEVISLVCVSWYFCTSKILQVLQLVVYLPFFLPKDRIFLGNKNYVLFLCIPTAGSYT